MKINSILRCSYKCCFKEEEQQQHSNYKKYKNTGSVTDYREFKGRNHFVLGQPTWKEDAGYILNWIEAHSL